MVGEERRRERHEACERKDREILNAFAALDTKFLREALTPVS